MRKILKAAAMLTVGGALLSTSAFAALGGSAVYNATTGKIDVNVSGLDTGESTIMVLKSATAINAIPSTVADADIVYIDQKTAASDGTATYSIDPGTRGADTGTYYVFAGGTNETTATFLGTATVPATGIVIKEGGADAAETKELTSGQTAAFTAVVDPPNAADKVTWTVSPNADGILSVAADGTATFNAPTVSANTDYVVTAKAGTATDSIKITVKPATVSATGVTIKVGDADAEDMSLRPGKTASFTATVTPSETTDTVAWTVKKGEEDVTDATLVVTDGVATFATPSDAVAGDAYTVTAKAGDFSDTVTIKVPRAKGDVVGTEDGKINSDDYLAVLQMSLGIGTWTDDQLAAGDVVGTEAGKINSDDYLAVLQKSLGIAVDFKE